MKRQSIRPEAFDEQAELRLSDLGLVGVLHDLLAALNDVTVDAPTLARHVDKFPALRARVSQEYVRIMHPRGRLPSTSEQLAVIGNRRFEGTLLELLEELTVLAAEPPKEIAS